MCVVITPYAARGRVTRLRGITEREISFFILLIRVCCLLLEKLGILGVTDRSRRRPGDVSFKSWAPNRGLAIDVAVICPLAAHLHEEEPCELCDSSQTRPL